MLARRVTACRSPALATGALAILLLSAASAYAQDARPQASGRSDPYVAVEMMLSPNGTWDGSGGAAGSGRVDIVTSASRQLLSSYGGRAKYVHPLGGYFALGGILATQSWGWHEFVYDERLNEVDTGMGRNIMLDFGVAPQARLPIAENFELFIEVPVGAAFNFLNTRRRAFLRAPTFAVPVEPISPGLGFTIGLVLGGRYVLSRHVGLLADIGLVHHRFSHSTKLPGNLPDGEPSGATVSNAFELTQLLISAGVFLR
jgi:hypothetical protein